jgi:hypothetical protein
MPTPMKISGRSSSITNAFFNSIIPVIEPTEEEIAAALDILQMNPADLRCSYCGDTATEWDHLRPLIIKQRPTGYISEIHNLVPACGKCNQSKGNKYWKDWITSGARLSPQKRGIPDLDERIERLIKYENWKRVNPIDLESYIGSELWSKHIENWQNILTMMKVAQEHAAKLNKIVRDIYKKKLTSEANTEKELSF